MRNKEISKIFKEISLYLEMDEVPFKPKAYEEASDRIIHLDHELSEIYKDGGVKKLKEIHGIGESIAKKIEKLVLKEKLPFYKKLKKKYPIDVFELNRVEGLATHKIKKLYEVLKIKDLKGLKKALENGKVSSLEGFGEKSQESLLKSVLYLEKNQNRWIHGFVRDEIELFVEELKKASGIKQIEIAGSARRMKSTIGDLDLVATSKNSDKLMNALKKHKSVDEVLASGKEKTLVRLKNGLEVDLCVVAPESFGAAFCYFTGSRSHTIALRNRALKNGCTLNEHGLYKYSHKTKKKGTLIASKTEADVYKKLKLNWIPPEMREDSGEFELSEKNKIPKLIDYQDLKGDLQVQTNWTDGENSIEEMALAAIDYGLEYILITDHTKSLAYIGGLDEKKLKLQMKEIDQVNKKLKGKITILKGAEVDILKDGSLDLDDRILKELDVVGAAVHRDLHLSKKEMTQRIKKAMSNPHVDILFHPTGRKIQQREAYELDIDVIIEQAKKTRTILEIDAFPDRSDLKVEYIHLARKAGVKMVINSDAHASIHYHYLRFGIGLARRGWCEKEDIINTYSLENMMKLLK